MKKPTVAKGVPKEVPEERICNTCFHRIGDECHKNPPVPVMSPNFSGKMIYRGVWPTIYFGDTCSQWAPGL